MTVHERALKTPKAVFYVGGAIYKSQDINLHFQTKKLFENVNVHYFVENVRHSKLYLNLRVPKLMTLDHLLLLNTKLTKFPPNSPPSFHKTFFF